MELFSHLHFYVGHRFLEKLYICALAYSQNNNLNADKNQLR